MIGQVRAVVVKDVQLWVIRVQVLWMVAKWASALLFAMQAEFRA